MNEHSKNPKKNTIKFIFIIFLFLVILIFISFIFYGINLSNKVTKIPVKKDEIGIKPEVEKILSTYPTYNNIINIALFGIDAGNNQIGRSDSIMILTIDPIHNKMKVSSIMRDSYVNIPGKGMDKLNHAFAFGNSVLALRTINENFDLNIDKFISTNFSNMPKIINKLGGIEINIREDEIVYINDSITESNKINGTNSPKIHSIGLQTLDGIQALSYSRIRYTSGGDYERTSRHRTVLNCIYKALKDTPMSEYLSLLNEFLPYIETNISTSELLNIGSTIAKIESSNLIEDRFPRDDYCNGEMIDNIYYLVFNKEPTINQMHEFIFESK